MEDPGLKTFRRAAALFALVLVGAWLALRHLERLLPPESPPPAPAQARPEPGALPSPPAVPAAPEAPAAAVPPAASFPAEGCEGGLSPEAILAEPGRSLKGEMPGWAARRLGEYFACRAFEKGTPEPCADFDRWGRTVKGVPASCSSVHFEGLMLRAVLTDHAREQEYCSSFFSLAGLGADARSRACASLPALAKGDPRAACRALAKAGAFPKGSAPDCEREFAFLTGSDPACAQAYSDPRLRQACLLHAAFVRALRTGRPEEAAGTPYAPLLVPSAGCEAAARSAVAAYCEAVRIEGDAAALRAEQEAKVARAREQAAEEKARKAKTDALADEQRRLREHRPFKVSDSSGTVGRERLPPGVPLPPPPPPPPPPGP